MGGVMTLKTDHQISAINAHEIPNNSLGHHLCVHVFRTET